MSIGERKLAKNSTKKLNTYQGQTRQPPLSHFCPKQEKTGATIELEKCSDHGEVN
jgi:hypothetical protein